MAFVFIFLITVITVCIFMAISTSKKAKENKLRMVDTGATSYFSASHVEGLGISANAPCDIMQFDDRVQIESGNNKFTIPINNIRAAVVKNEQELVEKGKSVVGRAVIGTLLVPGLGTIVGGLSGVGSKKKKGPMKTFLIINYTNSRGEMDAVTFLDYTLSVQSHKFCKNINSNINTSGEAIQL